MAKNELENTVSIDSIPYEILYQIVSLIPLKEAVRTIILSSSWKHLWTPLQVYLNLDFNQITSQETGLHMSKIISSFLHTYENSYQILNLSLLEPKSLHNKETLFLKAIKGVDKDLYISFHEQTENLKVFSFSIGLRMNKNDHFSDLKTLHLRSINHMAGSFLPALFSCCWNLETLRLEKCNGLHTIDLKGHDLLQKFEVLDCENVESVTISSGPNIKSFVYRGSLVKIVLKDVPKLRDVALNMNDTSAVCDYNEFDSEGLVPLLNSLKDVEVLVLSGWLLQWLDTRGITFDELEFKFDKLKELSWIHCCINTQMKDSLASFLSITPSLESLFIKIDEKWSTISCPHFHQPWSQLWMDTSIVNSNDFQLKHLKIVKFSGFKVKQENQMLVSLMDLMLKKAIALKKMTVAEVENKLSWRVAKVPQSQLRKISSSSRTCYSSGSSLLLSLNNGCCFQLTPLHDNYTL
ncbi:F-box domain, Leucine-rich repeat domain, L domain-like protein [Artemisia annua]|uniref:F-box domain, Leucine-rich repeat domain, L domain-like protein n=1 Tax=Artemisia annua TaxID=35608 RepID=A0A2U1KV40_ARTAN|nr:F-box domain, Leucine-rich repeat domain, L domain-like protein [Artemisia annua]